MVKKPYVTLLCLGVLLPLILLTCGKKEKTQKAFVIVDSDTILVEELSNMLPESTLTLRKLGLMVRLAKDCPQRVDTVAMNEAIEDFTDQLVRESGQKWKRNGAQNLYCASHAIKKKLDTSENAQDLQEYLDSLAAKTVVPSDSSPFTFSLTLLLFLQTPHELEKRNNWLPYLHRCSAWKQICQPPFLSLSPRKVY